MFRKENKRTRIYFYGEAVTVTCFTSIICHIALGLSSCDVISGKPSR